MASLIDSYEITLEGNLSRDDKAMMIGMTVLLDLIYAASREGKNQWNGGNAFLAGTY